MLVIVQETWLKTLMNWRLWVLPTALSCFLIILSQSSFLTFHTLTQFFTIIISFTMFALAWSTRLFSKNNFLLFLACGFFWVGSFDLLHTLTYKGINIFSEKSESFAIQYETVARYAEALLLLSAPFIAKKKQNGYLLFIAFGIISAGLMALVMFGKFPAGFAESYNLTNFNTYSEYIIILILALALVSLFTQGCSISTKEKIIIAASIVMMMCAELTLSFHASTSGLSDLAGHLFKLYSFWFIFQAIIILNLKKPYAELQASEERFNQSQKFAGVGTWESNIETGELFWSKSIAPMFGYENGTVTPTVELFLAAVHPDDRQMVIDAIQASRIDNKSYELEHRVVWKDGTEKWLHEKGAFIRNENGTPSRMVGVVRDISEHRQVEERLRQSQKMEAVGQLTGGVAHDFNNLLSIMIGNTEMLEDRIVGDAEAEHQIKALKKAVDRASALTSRLLAFSRQQPLMPEPTRVSSLVDGLDELLQRTLGETIELKIKPTPDLWPVTVDPHQFENVLVNLAINARDAMPTGGILAIETANVTLDATFTQQHEDISSGDYVKISVNDTGSGMPPDVLEKVFEPFFTTKGFGEGSGLGLSMVYGFCMQSKGHITVESVVGSGTTVTVFIPRFKEPAIQDNKAAELDDHERGTERILVVEDDEDVRIISSNALRKLGYKVVEAANGKEAIKHLKANAAFDLLFTDIILPGGMNGVQVAEKAQNLQPDIKVLYTTGYPRDTVIHEGELDADETLLNKPYRQAELVTKVRNILDND